MHISITPSSPQNNHISNPRKGEDPIPMNLGIINNVNTKARVSRISNAMLSTKNVTNYKLLSQLNLKDSKPKNELCNLKKVYNPEYRDNKNYLEYKIKSTDPALLAIERNFNMKQRTSTKLIDINQSDFLRKLSLNNKKHNKKTLESTKTSTTDMIGFESQFHSLNTLQNINFNQMTAPKKSKKDQTRDSKKMGSIQTGLLPKFSNIGSTKQESSYSTYRGKNLGDQLISNREGFEIDKLNKVKYYRYVPPEKDNLLEDNYYDVPIENIEKSDIKKIVNTLSTQCDFFKLNDQNKKVYNNNYKLQTLSTNPVRTEVYIDNYLKTFQKRQDLRKKQEKEMNLGMNPGNAFDETQMKKKFRKKLNRNFFDGSDREEDSVILDKKRIKENPVLVKPLATISSLRSLRSVSQRSKQDTSKARKLLKQISVSLCNIK